MTNDNLIFGIDIARYDSPVDWNKVKASPHNPKFIGIRGGISWAYVDPFFQSNWVGAGSIGLKRHAYFVAYFGEDAKAQVTNWKKILNGQVGEGAEVLDAELDSGLSYQTIQSKMYSLLQYMEDMFGRKPIIYTRADWVDQFVLGKLVVYPMNPPVWFNDYYWWLAQYSTTSEKASPPTLPIGVKREQVLIHQTAELPTPSGFGTASGTLDYDRFQNFGNPTFEQYYKIAPLPVEPTHDQKVEILWKGAKDRSWDLNLA